MFFLTKILFYQNLFFVLTFVWNQKNLERKKLTKRKIMDKKYIFCGQNIFFEPQIFLTKHLPTIFLDKKYFWEIFFR